MIKLLAHGPKKATNITEEIMKHGISDRTIKNAKRSIGIVSTRKSGLWYWSLPNRILEKVSQNTTAQPEKKLVSVEENEDDVKL